jgi:hypothetical protein
MSVDKIAMRNLALADMGLGADAAEFDARIPGPNPNRVVMVVTTGADGTASVAGLPSGAYRVLATHRGYTLVGESVALYGIKVPVANPIPIELHWAEQYGAVLCMSPKSACLTWGETIISGEARKNSAASVSGYGGTALKRRFPEADIVLTRTPSEIALARSGGSIASMQFLIDGVGWVQRNVPLRPVSSIEKPECLQFELGHAAGFSSFRFSIEPRLVVSPGAPLPKLQMTCDYGGLPLQFEINAEQEARLPNAVYSITWENQITASCFECPQGIDLRSDQHLVCRRTEDMSHVRFVVVDSRGGMIPRMDVTVVSSNLGSRIANKGWNPSVGGQFWGMEPHWWLPNGDYDIAVAVTGVSAQTHLMKKLTEDCEWMLDLAGEK